MLILLAFLAGFGLLALALCAKPIEGALKAARAARRQRRHRKRSATQSRQLALAGRTRKPQRKRPVNQHYVSFIRS